MREKEARDLKELEHAVQLVETKLSIESKKCLAAETRVKDLTTQVEHCRQQLHSSGIDFRYSESTQNADILLSNARKVAVDSTVEIENAAKDARRGIRLLLKSSAALQHASNKLCKFDRIHGEL